jgi:hypothetical protein
VDASTIKDPIINQGQGQGGDSYNSACSSAAHEMKLAIDIANLVAGESGRAEEGYNIPRYILELDSDGHDYPAQDTTRHTMTSLLLLGRQRY